MYWHGHGCRGTQLYSSFRDLLEFKFLRPPLAGLCGITASNPSFHQKEDVAVVYAFATRARPLTAIAAGLLLV